MAAEDNSQDRWVREEVGCALRLSGLTAQRRLAIAQTLTGVLAETGQALHRGRIGYLHAMTLAEATYPLDAETAAAVQARVLPRAGGQTLAEFKRCRAPRGPRPGPRPGRGTACAGDDRTAGVREPA